MATTYSVVRIFCFKPLTRTANRLYSYVRIGAALFGYCVVPLYRHIIRSYLPLSDDNCSFAPYHSTCAQCICFQTIPSVC